MGARKIQLKPGVALENMLRIALGQENVANLRAILRLCVYVAFVFAQVKLVEIFADGFTGSRIPTIAFHLIGLPVFTTIISTIEVLSLLALVPRFFFCSEEYASSKFEERNGSWRGMPILFFTGKSS